MVGGEPLRRRAVAKGLVLSRFTETMYGSAHSSSKGLVTGEPDCPVRHTWGEVHERARRIASGLATAGVGRGDAVSVLAGAPAEIAPAGQAVWMRGASLTMLHQPTPRTDLQRWAEETTAVIKMIGARTVVISDPFTAAGPLLSQLGVGVLSIEQLLESSPIDPVETDDDDIALLQKMLAQVIDMTGDVRPDLWRRYLTIVLDGLRTRRDGPTPLPVPALDLGALIAAGRAGADLRLDDRRPDRGGPMLDVPTVSALPAARTVELSISGMTCAACAASTTATSRAGWATSCSRPCPQAGPPRPSGHAPTTQPTSTAPCAPRSR